MAELLTVTFVVSLFSGMIRIATPIIYSSLGELVTERSGILNLGVEGTMLMGAFVGFLTAYKTHSLWLGYVFAMLAGGGLGLLMAFLSSTLKVDQIVAGLTINLLSSGLTFYLYRLAFKDVASANMPNIEILRTVPIPLLSQIPVLGEIFFKQGILTYIAFIAMAPLLYFFLYRTKHGLQLRCIGENPRAMEMKGVNIFSYQYLAVIFGGVLAGIGGGFLVLSYSGMFLPYIVGGRGWIAIAIVIFGDWKPFRILFMALFFGFLDSIQLQIQGLGIQFPYQALLALPYVLTIVALVFGRRRAGAPLALGIRYDRG